jgi:hypothetical protein
LTFLASHPVLGAIAFLVVLIGFLSLMVIAGTDGNISTKGAIVGGCIFFVLLSVIVAAGYGIEYLWHQWVTLVAGEALALVLLIAIVSAIVWRIARRKNSN